MKILFPLLIAALLGSPLASFAGSATSTTVARTARQHPKAPGKSSHAKSDSKSKVTKPHHTGSSEASHARVQKATAGRKPSANRHASKGNSLEHTSQHNPAVAPTQN